MPDPIRRASAADIPAIIALNREVQALHAALDPKSFKEEASEKEVAEYFAGHLAREENEFAIHESDGQALGYIWVALQHRAETPFTHARQRLIVHQIVVTQTARGSGVGRALMNWAEERAMALAADEVLLDHLATNTLAAAFYDALGFKVHRVERIKLR